jgi:dihydrofolate reductase
MIISLIAAMSDQRVIGRDGKLPWHIPTDLARFKSITTGHTLIMGRRTFESIGHPLPERRNIVLSRTVEKIKGCEIARSLHEAIAALEGEEEIFICGGEKVFREALPLCQRIYLTVVHGVFEGDVHFPQIPEGFQEVQREERPNLEPPLSFVILEKEGKLHNGADLEVLRQKGGEAIQRQLYFLARSCFEQALTQQDSPDTASDLAYCIAKSGGDLDSAMRLAAEALQAEPGTPRFYLNLARIQLMAGLKKQGLETLRQGLRHGGGQEILAELAKLGTRSEPPIRALPRSHPLNRYLGLMLHKMGLKK